MCEGKCSGTCAYTPGKADCEGECHGECDAQLSPPVCTGKIDCMAAAECQGNCKAKADANFDCPAPQVTVVVEGDLELQTAIEAHAAAWGEAVNATLALQKPIAAVAGKTEAAFTAVGDVGLAGATCFASSFQSTVEASASINVSVSASASVSGSSS
jgi:hypothetical protein